MIQHSANFQEFVAFATLFAKDDDLWIDLTLAGLRVRVHARSFDDPKERAKLAVRLVLAASKMATPRGNLLADPSQAITIIRHGDRAFFTLPTLDDEIPCTLMSVTHEAPSVVGGSDNERSTMPERRLSL